MNQRRIDRLIPLAFSVLVEENGVAKKIFKTIGNEKKIVSAYKGYMSSIGPSIVQAGLIKTITAFSKESKNTNEDKSITCKLIKQLLLADGHYSSADRNTELNVILSHRIDNKPTTVRISEEDRILEAIAAYKLVFDTYAKYDEKKEKNEVEHG